MTAYSIFAKPRSQSVIFWLAAGLYLTLFLTMFITPAKFLAGVSVTADASTCYLLRRASMLMLAMAVLAFQAGRAESSALRRRAAVVLGTNMACFAAMSLWAVARGIGGSAWLVPGIIETVFAVLAFLAYLGARPGPEPSRPLES